MFNLDKFKDRRASLLGLSSSKLSAVLLPIVYKEGKPFILFEKRSLGLQHQPGEICFPGGKIEESDKNPKETAFRETCEEIGVLPKDIDYIGALDVLFSPFDVVIYPYVGVIKKNIFSIDQDEVQEIFSVPLDFFLENEPEIYYLKTTVIFENEDFPFHLIPKGRNYPWRFGQHPVLFYRYKDRIIWGMTARILNNFIQIAKNKMD